MKRKGLDYMRLDDISRIIKEKGVAGAGGAGFPSYAKLNTKADTLILNCAECEPLLKLHRQLLEKYALEIFRKNCINDCIINFYNFIFHQTFQKLFSVPPSKSVKEAGALTNRRKKRKPLKSQ